MRKIKLLIIFFGIIYLLIGKFNSNNRHKGYNLIGKYSLETFSKDGFFESKRNSNLAIIKENDKYTLIGKQYSTEKVTDEILREVDNDNFIFTGKIVSSYSEKNNNELFPYSENTIFYSLENENGERISIILYPNVKINKLKNLNKEEDYYNLKGLKCDNIETSDIITLTSKNENIIKFIFVGIKEK